jgi:hypothetical protein
VKDATRFDEQPGIWFEAIIWVVALTVLFTGGWLGEMAGRLTSSHVIAGLVGAATAVATFWIVRFREDPTSDEKSSSLLPRPLKIGSFVILAALLGIFLVRTVLRLARSLDYNDSTTIGFGGGLILAAAIWHWRTHKALKRQHSR